MVETEKIKELKEIYEERRFEIKKRLKEFKKVMNCSDEKIFAELAFCICTPQSKASLCDQAIKSLDKNRLLYEGSAEQMRPFLNLIRFADNKVHYIVHSRNLFTENKKLKIKEKIRSFDDAYKLRVWLVDNVKGLGMKEASHFLRNIGLGKDLAILDRHILKNLKAFNVIEKVPKVLTNKQYLAIEQRMKKFAERIKIPLDELDLLLWSKETGKILK